MSCKGLKLKGVLAAFVLFAYGGLASAAEPSSVPTTKSLQLAALGAPVEGIEPLGVNDIFLLEPVCALIFKHYNLLKQNPRVGQWYIQLKGSPLLNLPEYNIAKGAISFHHYCWSKVAENRYYREMNPVKRKGLADYAADNYKFVLDHPEYRPANWPYLPKLYVDYGNALILRWEPRQMAIAVYAFETALQYDKAYVPAIIGLSNIYEKQGDQRKALEYITEGLRYLPDSKGLKRRYGKLGGKRPYPAEQQTLEVTDEPAGKASPERQKGAT